MSLEEKPILFKPTKKAVWTLNVGRTYSPEICDITYPFMERYARNIGADFNVLSSREFPGYPVVYEKFQIHTVGRLYEWNIYFDSDTLIHPDLFDLTSILTKDTILQYDHDKSFIRFDPDLYMLRDNRWIGAGNWFTVASDWCLDIWKPLDDIRLEQAISRIRVTTPERLRNIEPAHLIDDFTMTRNIARFGLKCKSFKDLVGLHDQGMLFHDYWLTGQQKAEMLKDVLNRRWGIK